MRESHANVVKIIARARIYKVFERLTNAKKSSSHS